MERKSLMEIAGIVLIGGKSKRMGKAKAFLKYEGQFFYIRAAELLERHLPSVYISGSEQQKNSSLHPRFPFLVDKYENIGPIAGIISAFEHLRESKCALLVVATDMPYLNDSLIRSLLKARKKEKLATIYRNKASGFLEPLCAIYEFQAFDRIKEFVENKQFAIYKMFEDDELEYIDYENAPGLYNINTPEELKKLT